MKKKILLSLAIVAVAALAAFNVTFDINADNGLSAITLANAEALAQNENDKKGVEKITTIQTGSSYACIDGKGYKVVSFNRDCTGIGDLECGEEGDFSVYTPSSAGCGGV